MSTRSIFPRLLAAAVLLGLAAPSSVAADALDLRQAMTLARTRAREAETARHRATAANERAREAAAMRLPTVSLREIWIRTDSPAEAFGLLLNQERFSLAEFAAGDPNAPSPTENALTRLELSLPLYTGGELPARIRQARLAAGAAQETAAWIEEGAALAGAEAYIRLSQAREQVALLESALETARAHERLARAFVDQGMLVRSELLRAEVERSRLEDLLSQARGQARVAEAGLSFHLAADLSTSWQLERLPDPTPLAEGLEGWLAAAATRPDLVAAEGMLAAGELEVQARRSGRLPRVALMARRDFNDDTLFGSAGDSTAIMAVAAIDLFSGGRHRAAAAAARAEAEAGRTEVERLRAGIQLAIRDAYERAASARERHHTALAALDAAHEAERITEARFRQGVVRTIDLLDAATARREAETRELVARAEAHLAALDLAVQAGRRPETMLPQEAATAPAATHGNETQARSES
jgi:outer membrane protein TolC